ncbi:SDR family oxidoreductase [Aeromicrobium sp. UC242_57]|uniref:SDR family oxidoreductase n=1 Tax=Aeromicrobium sp. UC242_57 TaxID=3374624 RepID=UPI0037BDC8DE
MLPPGTFEGRCVAVTGAGSGLGQHIALSLGALGAEVALIGRRVEPLEETRALIRADGGVGECWPLDVRDRDQVEAAFSDIAARWGPVRHLVNSAAGNFRAAPEEITPNGWAAVTKIVLDGSWNCTQVMGRDLIAAGVGGSVVSIGSAKAHSGSPDTVHSASAKAGVLAMMKSLALAWGAHGIRLNTVSPGVTADTEAARRLFGDETALQRDIDRVPLARHAVRHEVSDAVTYLLSDFANYITGTELAIDGGRSLAGA